MEDVQNSEKVKHPSEDTTAKLLTTDENLRNGQKSWETGIPTNIEQENLLTSSSLKEVRRKSSATLRNLQKIQDYTGDIKVYKRRWLVLSVFLLYGIVGTFQWSQYSIISNVITKYYNVSNLAVDLTNLSFMAGYLITFLPAGWFLNKAGMRRSMILSCSAMALGCLLRVFSVERDRFWLTMTGQCIVGISQVFPALMSAPLAALWFPAHQVSFACSIAFNGILVGNAIGFSLPPILVRNSDDFDQIGADLNVMYMGVAVAAFAVLILVLLFFQDKPPLPPSYAQKVRLGLEPVNPTVQLWRTTKYILRKKSYLILVISFSLNLGAFIAYGTLLNQILIPHFPGHETEVGVAGLVLIINGIFSSLACGYILDRTHAFKLTIVMLNLLSLVAWIAFACLLRVPDMTYVLIASGVLGLAQGNQPSTLEFGVEITFPEPEGITSGVTWGIAQLFGIVITLYYGYALTEWGDVIANTLMAIPLALSVVIMLFMRPTLKRQAAHKQHKIPQQLNIQKC